MAARSSAADFFPLDVTDFGPAIQKIQAAKPDMVVSVLVGGAHISFYRQWAAAGMKNEIPMASTTFGGGNENMVLSPEEGDGITVAFSYFQELDTPANKAFLEQVPRQARRQRPLSRRRAGDAHLCWLQHLGRGRAQGRVVDRMKVIEALESGISFEGPAGKTVLDPKTHHATSTSTSPR